MENTKKNKITEEEVCFLTVTDRDPNLQGDLLRVQYNEHWFHLSAFDFFGWMYETGRITHYGEDLVCDGHYKYTFEEFIRARNLDAEFIAYQQAGAPMKPEKTDWLSDIRAPQPAGEYPATGYTPDQEAALYEYHDMMDFSHPNEKTR
ncbi:MAG: hypothetical protein J5I98_35315 [Phaeodactylibacter sp.]|nr:hypothetical protein [Phaeodactylibacter sp.]